MSEYEPGEHDVVELREAEEQRWADMTDPDIFNGSSIREVRYKLQAPNRLRRMWRSTEGLPRRALAVLGALGIGAATIGILLPDDSPSPHIFPTPRVSYEPSPEVSGIIVRPDDSPYDGSVTNNNSGTHTVTGDVTVENDPPQTD